MNTSSAFWSDCTHWHPISFFRVLFSGCATTRTIALVLTTLVDVYLNNDSNPLEGRSSAWRLAVGFDWRHHGAMPSDPSGVASNRPEDCVSLNTTEPLHVAHCFLAKPSSPRCLLIYYI